MRTFPRLCAKGATNKPYAAISQIINSNSNGKIAEAVGQYDDLKRSGHKFSLLEYNSILASFAPRKLMFKWFTPYKDFIDMYYEAGKYKPRERIDEAKHIWEDLQDSGLTPDVVSYNSLMKVQLSSGKREVEKCFLTYNEMSEKMNPNISSFALMLRACALIENVTLGEEIYAYAIYKFVHENPTAENHVTIAFYNAMLDVYAEGRNEKIFPFFEQMIQKKLPVNGATFGALAKSIVFLDQRHRLVYLPEMMRVEGVLQKELSKPIRSEIYDAMKKHSHYYKSDDLTKKSYEKMIEDRVNVFSQFTNSSHILTNQWGRMEDIHSYHVYQNVKPHMQKYMIDYSKVLTPDFGKFSGKVSEATMAKVLGEFPESEMGPLDPKDVYGL